MFSNEEAMDAGGALIQSNAIMSRNMELALYVNPRSTALVLLLIGYVRVILLEVGLNKL